MNDVEQAALKFAAVALKNAIDQAKSSKNGVKEYPNGKIAIRTSFLNLQRNAKAVVMEVAKKYGIARYGVVNITKMKPERAIIIDLTKLKQALYDNIMGEERGEDTTVGGLVLRIPTPNKSRTLSQAGGELP